MSGAPVGPGSGGRPAGRGAFGHGGSGGGRGGGRGWSPDRSDRKPETPARPSGLLIVDKPLRKTSATMTNLVKARLIAGGAPPRVKVGHAGTLDPLATGVLVVLIGRATRLQDTIMATEKRYEAVVDLAHVSATDDLESEAEPVHIAATPRLAEVERVLREHFTGEVMQAPPVHSAVKVDGRRAYDLARAGELDRLDKRPVRIDVCRVIDYTWPLLRIGVTCGKGTYIRSLARDIGIALGTGGMLAGLRRTGVGPFPDAIAVTPDVMPDPLLQEHLLVTPEVRGLMED